MAPKSKWFEGIEGLILNGDELIFKGERYAQYDEECKDELYRALILVNGEINDKARLKELRTKLEKEKYCIITNHGACAGAGG